MTMSKMERRLASLKDKNGASLLKHPTYLYLHNLVNVPVYILQSRRDMQPVENRVRLYDDQREIARFVVEIVGMTMTVEELNALLRETNTESDTSLQAIHTAYNKIKSISEVLLPDLHKITVDIRQSRQTVEMEMRDALKWLTTVREFFLESKYELEMKRLREFIELCKEIQALKDAGTLDAVADLAVRLAIGRAQQ